MLILAELEESLISLLFTLVLKCWPFRWIAKLQQLHWMKTENDVIIEGEITSYQSNYVNLDKFCFTQNWRAQVHKADIRNAILFIRTLL